MLADSAAQSPPSTGERSRRSLRIVNKRVRVATFNVRTCPAGERGLWKLSGLAAQLQQLDIGLAGLQELRRTESGHSDIPSPDSRSRWSLLWSGHSHLRQHGVGLLLAREWEDALISFEPISDRLLVARFAGDRKQTITVIVGYSPTDCDEAAAAADSFYNTLAEQCTKASDRKELIIALGDFNAALGKDTSSKCIGQEQPATVPSATSPNGLRLLTVAAIANLRVANTFFRHKPSQQYTHRGPRRRPKRKPSSSKSWRRNNTGSSERCSVKDYILISAQHMRSVRDCKALRGVAWRSDHTLVALTLRLSLKARQPLQLQRRPWDSNLLTQPEARDSFCLELENRFEALQPLDAAAVDSQQECSTFISAMAEVASSCLKPAAASRRRAYKFALSQRSLGAMAAARKARQAWLGSKSVAGKANWHRAQRQADRSVQLDLQSWTRAQAQEASDLLQRRDARGFAQAAKRMAGQQRRSSAPTSMRDAEGRVQQGPRGVEQALTSHFAALLGGKAELTADSRAAIEAQVVLFESLHDTGQVDENAGAEPSLEEVAASVKALRNHAAPGDDLVDARMLKAGPVVVEWLHRVVTAVWRSGKAPVEWKRALVVPIYKNKGPKDEPGGYRGISLLSIPGKVYASVLLHRVAGQVEGKLSEAQCGFRPGRGTVDAMYVLRSLGAACGEFNTCLAKAYIDLTKAYDSIDRWALWKVLRLYNVHPKLIALLEDLHSGTTAAVRLEGRVGPAFDVTAGVRQGCVIAPMLFNIFMDHVVNRALARMPEGCGVHIQVQGRRQAEGETAAAPGSIERIVLLMYADDVVLLSHDPSQLATMLVAMDQVALEYGMTINAAKTEIQVQQAAKGKPLPVTTVELSGGQVKVAQDFKYLGSWIGQDWGVDKEVATRRGRALGVFQSFSNVWANRKLGLAEKMAVYNSFVVPHFLYGAEAWNCTAGHIHALETAHTACLRRIMGVSRADRHRLQHIRTVCGSQPLELMLIKRTFQWLGHVMRMPNHRYPAMVFGCIPEGGKRGRGRPKAPYRHTHKTMLERLGVADPEPWLEEMHTSAQNRVTWRAMVKGFELSEPRTTASKPARVQPGRACKGGSSR